MELNGNTLAVAGVIAMILIVEMRLLRRELKIYFGALMERNRRRNRRESQNPPVRRRDAVPETWADEDTTDLHELVELERKHQRRRPGERPPRPGTHHDR